jgi:hypothetical protein
LSVEMQDVLVCWRKIASIVVLAIPPPDEFLRPPRAALSP